MLREHRRLAVLRKRNYVVSILRATLFHGGRSVAETSLVSTWKPSASKCSARGARDGSAVVVLSGVHFARAWLGEGGVMAGGFLLGLTDVDALTLAMTRSVSTGTSIELACRAILVGVIANSLMKAGIAIIVGERRFAWQTAASLAAMAAAGAATLALR